MKCRRCKQPIHGDAIYLGAGGQKTLKPACRPCYERLVQRSVRGAFYRGFLGPGKTADVLPDDSLEALDYYEALYGSDPDGEGPDPYDGDG